MFLAEINVATALYDLDDPRDPRPEPYYVGWA